jgi:hypothetical protein
MTLFGSHTADELRDLVKAKDYDIDQIQKAYDDFAPSWQTQDAAGAADWLVDWKRFRDRYTAARLRSTIALTAADVVPGPDNLKPVETVWQGVLDALTVKGTSPAGTKGNFQELHNRFATAQKKPVDFSKQPTPIAIDTDLQAYQGADKVVKGIEAGKKAAEKAAGSFLADNWPWILGGALALGFGASVAKKVL